MPPKLKHKYVQELEAGKSAWAVLCSPSTLNSKFYNRAWKRENASYRWDEVTCRQCLRLRQLDERETYLIRKGLKFLAKGEVLE